MGIVIGLQPEWYRVQFHGDKLTLVRCCQVFSGVQCNCGDKLTLVQ